MPSDNDRLLMMSKGKSIGCGCLIIPGPLEAYNMDKPVKVLSHFHDSWRYYWVMEYLDRGAWRWGIVSVIFIILRKVFFLARRRNIKHNGHRRAFFHDYSRPGLYMVTMVEVCKVPLMPGDSDFKFS